MSEHWTVWGNNARYGLHRDCGGLELRYTGSGALYVGMYVEDVCIMYLALRRVDTLHT